MRKRTRAHHQSNPEGGKKRDARHAPTKQELENKREQDDNEEDEDEERAVDREPTILAVAFGRSAEAQGMGAAFYDPEENRLGVFGRMLGDNLNCMLKRLVDQAKADFVVVSSKAPAVDASVPLERLKSSAFDSTLSFARLAEVGYPKHMLGTIMDLSNDLCISALGAAVFVAQREQCLPDGGPSRLETINLDDHMLISLESLHSLDILKKEAHPSIVRGNNSLKEGFSLLTLLDGTRSALGRKVLKNWIHLPLANITLINQRLDAVQFLTTSQVQEVHQDLRQALVGLRDVLKIFARIRKRVASTTDWIAFAESIHSIDAVIKVVKQLSTELPPLLACVAACDNAYLRRVPGFLNIIDWEESKQAGWLVPAQNVSQELDDARLRYNNLDLILENASKELVALYGEPVVLRYDMKPVFIPLLGFLIQTREPSADSSLNMPLPKGFDLVFRRESTPVHPVKEVYFRSDLTELLNETHGDLYQMVRTEEQRVCRHLEDNVVEHEGVILKAAIQCGTLDVLLSFATAALDFDYVRPTLVDGTSSLIKQGQHPLLRVNTEQYVPNDVHFAGENGHTAQDGGNVPSILVITGANYSGKSAYLKMVGLFHVMAQVGSFVPAEYAEIGVVDRLFTRIESLESSVDVMESSFSLDTQQIAHMISSCTPASLLLIDEYGKGTNSLDGASLLASVIHHLSQRMRTPRTIVTTHFSEIFCTPLIASCSNLLPCEMRVLVEEEQEVLEEEGHGERQNTLAALTKSYHGSGTAVPLFKLNLGSHSSCSYALACARLANLPEACINRARTVMLLRANGLKPSSDEEKDKQASLVLDKLLSRTKPWSEATDDEVRALFVSLETLLQ